jgi:protein involved in polysaccharide export with SLBB domain
VIFALLGGCASKGVLMPGDRAAADAAPRQGPPDPTYHVGAGDVLEVRRSGGQFDKVEVRSDGSIRLGTSDSVRVDNLTTVEIADQLRESLGQPYANCRVGVAKYNSQFVYVFGDSRQESQRAVPYQGRETLREFLARVGCRQCWRGYRARIVRPNESIGATPEVVAVKLDAGLQIRGRNNQDPLVRPNDYVYIERDGAGPGDIVPRSDKSWTNSGK